MTSRSFPRASGLARRVAGHPALHANPHLPGVRTLRWSGRILAVVLAVLFILLWCRRAYSEEVAPMVRSESYPEVTVVAAHHYPGLISK